MSERKMSGSAIPQQLQQEVTAASRSRAKLSTASNVTAPLSMTPTAVASSTRAKLSVSRGGISTITPLSLTPPMHQPGDREDHPTWTYHVEYILSSVGYCVGLGNIWRFPYTMYLNGGGSYFVPYFILLFLGGIPMFLLESSLGQFTQSGVLTAFCIIPVFKGVGWLALVNAFLVAVYYVFFMVYSLKYFFGSFQMVVPWSRCQRDWGDDCYDGRNETGDRDGNSTSLPYCQVVATKSVNAAARNCRVRFSPAEKYWQHEIVYANVPHRKDEPVHADLAILLLINYFVVFLCVSKGIKTSSRVAAVTSVAPYILITGFMIYGFTLKGAETGLRQLMKPDWQKVTNIETWSSALSQMFFSLSLGLGGATMYGSFNKLHNPIDRDVLIISFLDFFASVLASVCVFSVIGYLANKQGVDVKDFTPEGGTHQNLLFVLFPQAIVEMDEDPRLFSIVFFLLLFCLGLDTHFTFVLTLHTAFQDEFGFARKHKTGVLVGLCVVLFLCGLPFTQANGYDNLILMDKFVVDVSVTFCVCCEAVVVAWIYGVKRYVRDVEFMIGPTLNNACLFCWGLSGPITALVLFSYSLYCYLGATCEKPTDELLPDKLLPDKLPREAKLACCLLVAAIVPAVAVYMTYKYHKVVERWKDVLKVPLDWGPGVLEHYREYRMWRSARIL